MMSINTMMMHLPRPPARICVAAASLRRLALPQSAARRCYSASSSTSHAAAATKPSKMRLSISATAAISIISSSLFILSDPVSSVIFSNTEDDDVNKSYWASDVRKETGQQQMLMESKLRNAHKFNEDEMSESNLQILPSQARIVIVGGGFAGLHTALALAEKMSLMKHTNSRYQWLRRLFHYKSNNVSTDAEGEIIILEANQIGTGPSSRAKGLVVPGFQVPLEDLEEGAIDNEGEQPWTMPLLLYKLQSYFSSKQHLSDHPRYTKEVVQELYKLTYIALDRLRSIVDKYDIDCDWIECGAVEGSIHPSEEEDGKDDNDGCLILTGEEVDAMMGRYSSSSGDNSKTLYKSGEYDPSCALVNPLKLTIGLANAAESRWGVQIYENSKVVKLEKTSDLVKQKEVIESCKGKYMITTNDGSTIQCDHVVLCAGGETLSKEVSNVLKRALIPIYTWMAATEPLHNDCPLKDRVTEDKGRQKIRPAPACGDDHISLNYWRNNNKDDGRLLFGSLADTFILPEWLISWRLHNALKEVYPQLGNVQFDHIWGGRLAFALNAMPLIGRDSDYDDDDDIDSAGVWYATGFGGHGIVPTAMAGSVLANAILGIPGQQQLQLFQKYFPPPSFNGYPFSRLGAGMILLTYNVWEWLGKKGLPLSSLPKLW